LELLTEKGLAARESAARNKFVFGEKSSQKNKKKGKGKDEEYSCTQSCSYF